MVVLVATVIGVVALIVALPDPTGQVADFDASAIAAGAPVADNEADNELGDTPATPAAAPAATPGKSPATSQPTRSADRSQAPAAASAPARPDSAATGPAPTVPARTVPATTVAVPLQEIHSVMWTGDSVSFDLAPGVVASLTAAGLDVDVYGSYYGLRLVADKEHYDLAKIIPERAAEVRPEIVLMQISFWDGTADDDTYRAALKQLAVDLDFLGASLVVVAAPPTERADLGGGPTRLFGVATDLAAESVTDNLDVLDPAPMWGPVFVLDFDGDGVPEREQDTTPRLRSGRRTSAPGSLRRSPSATSASNRAIRSRGRRARGPPMPATTNRSAPPPRL